MARTRDRIVALTITVLFFAFSFSASFWVIWQLYKDNKEAKRVNNQQQDTSNNTPAKTTSNAGKLQGTQLANYSPVSSVDSLQTIDLQEGNGTEVKPGDTVTVDYTGAVAATGIVFQSSLDSGQPVTFPLGNVIKGWQNGIPGMKVGGKRRLLIPADQAYGATPPQGSGIPANAALVFDVTLHSVSGS